MTGTVTDSKSFVWDTLSAVPLLLSDGEFEFIYGTGTAPFAQVEIATGDVTFLHGDYVGSTRTATNLAGGVVGEWDYSLYGVVTQVSGSAGVTDFLFAGEYQDESGMYYLRNRYYDPVTASFISVDPILGATGMPYAYTAGNPLQGTDPLGLYSFGDFFDDVGDAGEWVWDTVSDPAFIAGTATFIGCSILTGPVGAIPCMALAGAVGAGVSYASLPFECQSWGGFFTSVALGAGTGALLGWALGPVVSTRLVPWVQRVAAPVINRLIPQAVQNALRMPVTQVAQVVRNRVSTVLRPNSAGTAPSGTIGIADDVAQTFKGAGYSSSVTEGELLLVRYYGGTSEQIGSYWTRTLYSSSGRAQQYLALPPGNTAVNFVTIRVPTGTAIFEGQAASAFGRLGGGNQVYIPRVDPAWIVP